MTTMTLTQEEYTYIMTVAEELEKERIYRKAPVNARKAAARLLEVIDQAEAMGAEDFLAGFNRYGNNLTIEQVARLRADYQKFGMWALLDSEYK